jgi:CheY-like chemotaxis protein
MSSDFKTNTTMDTARILLVDDEVVLADAYAQQLRFVGFTVDVAHNGADALSLARAKDYDAVVSDILMPIMDGQEFYEKLRGYKPGLADRLIFMTAYSSMMSQVTQKFVRSTHADLRKPFTFDQLLNSLSKVVPAYRWPKKPDPEKQATTDKK